MDSINIYELKRMDLKGATVIDGFPSVGLVSSIAANYLISALHLEQIGIMDSVYFPTVSLIRDSMPQNPVRIYAGEKVVEGGKTDQVVAFISEFQPPPNLIKSIASAIIDWAQDQKCDRVISPEGLVIEREDLDNSDGEERRDIEVYGVGSTLDSRELLRTHGVLTFQEGVITGVAGVLLNEGKRRDFDVISLLAEAHPDYPDARAAAKVIETIDKILSNIPLDAKPLYEEAERIETQLKAIHKQTVASKKVPKYARPSMYG